MRRAIILDTDLSAGISNDIDDAVALAYAVRHRALDVKMVTTVSGNTTARLASAAVKHLLHLLGDDDGQDYGNIPVVAGGGSTLTAGSAGPIIDDSPPPHLAEYLAADAGNNANFAAAEIARLVLAHPREITVVAIGPLTNIALALSLHPDVAAALGGLVVMGGSFLSHSHGYGTPGEWNLFVDPIAAQIVLNHPDVTPKFVGLDVTNKVHFTAAEALAISQSKEQAKAFIGEAALAWMGAKQRGTFKENWRQRHCCLHDPAALVALTRPELFQFQADELHVSAVPETRGLALIRNDGVPPHNCQVALGVDAAKVVAEIWSTIDGQSPAQ